MTWHESYSFPVLLIFCISPRPPGGGGGELLVNTSQMCRVRRAKMVHEVAAFWNNSFFGKAFFFGQTGFPGGSDGEDSVCNARDLRPIPG